MPREQLRAPEAARLLLLACTELCGQGARGRPRWLEGAGPGEDRGVVGAPARVSMASKPRKMSLTAHPKPLRGGQHVSGRAVVACPTCRRSLNAAASASSRDFGIRPSNSRFKGCFTGSAGLDAATSFLSTTLPKGRLGSVTLERV
jgi:hypothetical protein